VNKIGITVFPFPATLLAVQLGFAAVGMWIMGALKVVEVEPLTTEKVFAFGVTPLAFLATLVANIKILEYANVETFIMVRNSTPLATCVLDWFFLGRELPDMRSWFALLIAALGAGGYMYFDAQFQMTAYSWAVGWLAIFLFDQVYIKHVISTVQMSNWTRVYYTNFIAALPVLVYATQFEGFPANLQIYTNASTLLGASVVGISCAMGMAMSFFSFYARDSLPATSFTVVGNICKILSVLLNVIIWDKHASPTGLMALLLCILGSGLYKPAPAREKSEKLPLIQKIGG